MISFGFFTKNISLMIIFGLLSKHPEVLFISMNYIKIILWFFSLQIILMICNMLNGLTAYFHNNLKANYCSSHHSCVLCGAALYAIAFLLPWFPWKYYHKGDWLSGLHLVVLLCVFHTMLTFVLQAHCALFVDIFTRHESWLQFVKINQVATLI